MTTTKTMTFEDYAALEPKLHRVKRRIIAIRKKNFETKGSWQLDPFYGEALWYGANDLISVEGQIEELVGPYSKSPHKELHSEDALVVCLNHLSRLFMGRDAL